MVELHDFDNFDFILDGEVLLHGDHTLLSDSFYSLGNGVTDVGRR